MRRLITSVTLFIAATACGTDSATPGQEAGDAGPDAAGNSVAASCEGRITQPVDSDWTIVSGGIERNLQVHVPAQYDPTAPTPLVLNFHGFTSNASQQRLLSRMDAKADTEGFIAVYPNGTGSPQSWNADVCCGDAQQNQIDDVQFVRDMLSELENRLCIDTTRIYATGMSNGGFMSHRLACELSDRIAAIAPVAGHALQLTCDPTRPVPVAHFHGDLDTVVPYAGSAGLGFPPVPDSIAAWAERNGCSSTTQEVFQEGDSLCVEYSTCPAGGEVILCTVEDGGHTWPGGVPVPTLGKTTSDLSATDFMWEFFQDKQRLLAP